MAKTAELEAALLLDLKGIKVANGFATNVARVYTRKVDEAKVEVPSIAFTPEGGGKRGSSEQLTMGQGVSEAVDAWRLELLVKSPAAEADIRKLKDDVRNALERPSSALRAVAGVQRVDVTEWSELVLTEDRAGQWGLLLATVEAVYTYRKGGL